MKGGLDFRTQQYPGGTEFFQNQGGGGRGERRISEIFMGEGLLEMKLQTENKI